MKNSRVCSFLLINSTNQIDKYMNEEEKDFAERKKQTYQTLLVKFRLGGS